MATKGERYQALCDFLGSAFTPPEFREFLVLYYGDREDALNLHRDTVPGKFFFNVVTSMDRRGLIGAAFFDLLKETRYGRRAEIAGLERAWLSEDRKDVEPSDGTTSMTPPEAAPAGPATLLHQSYPQDRYHDRPIRLGVLSAVVVPILRVLGVLSEALVTLLRILGILSAVVAPLLLIALIHWVRGDSPLGVISAVSHPFSAGVSPGDVWTLLADVYLLATSGFLAYIAFEEGLLFDDPDISSILLFWGLAGILSPIGVGTWLCILFDLTSSWRNFAIAIVFFFMPLLSFSLLVVWSFLSPHRVGQMGIPLRRVGETGIPLDTYAGLEFFELTRIAGHAYYGRRSSKYEFAYVNEHDRGPRPEKTSDEIGPPPGAAATVRRRTRVDFPGLCRIDHPARLEVQLTIEEPAVTAVRAALDVPLPAPDRPARLLVVVHAPGFEVLESSKTIEVPPDGDSDVAAFDLIPRSAGVHRIEIEIFSAAGRIGFLIVRTRVEPTEGDRHAAA